jgi:hypothetical protein
MSGPTNDNYTAELLKTYRGKDNATCRSGQEQEINIRLIFAKTLLSDDDRKVVAWIE